MAGDGDNDADSNPGYTYSIPSQAGATYMWSVTAGGHIIGSTTSTSVQVYFDAGAGPFTLSVAITTSGGSTTPTKGITKAGGAFYYEFADPACAGLTAPSWAAATGAWTESSGSYTNTTSSQPGTTRMDSASYTQVYSGSMQAEARMTRTGGS